MTGPLIALLLYFAALRACREFVYLGSPLRYTYRHEIAGEELRHATDSIGGRHLASRPVAPRAAENAVRALREAPPVD